MRDFDLVSIDWDTVRLMQAGQFKQETFYLEELGRWALQRGRAYGLMHLEDDGISKPSSEGGQTFSVMVKGCFAVTPGGRIIDIPDDRQVAVVGSLEARATVSLVPLYLGVSITDRQKEPKIYPTIDTGLLGCGGMRRRYRIASDDSDDSVDWLQIALFEKTANGLSFSEDYLPECFFLSSHASLLERQKEIGDLAKRTLELLTRESSSVPTRFMVAAALCGSLGPAARVVDRRLSPSAYVDRLAGVFAAQRAQLLALPNPNLTDYQAVLKILDETLTYLDASDWTLGQALLLARECFERLLKLYGPLLRAMETAGPAPDRYTPEHKPVLEAERPDKLVPQTPEKRPGKGFWRG